MRHKPKLNRTVSLSLIAVLIAVLTNVSNVFQAAAAPEMIAGSSGAASGNFTVRGSTIYDPDGKPFIAKGVNVNGYNWVWSRETTQDVSSIVDCWKFNLVRVDSFLFTGQTRYWQYTTNNDLHKIVDAFTARKIVVLIETHDRIGTYFQNGDLSALVNWYTQLATQFKNNPYVWFDVMNEPGGAPPSVKDRPTEKAKWLNVHRQVIQAVRDTVGATNLIMAEGMDWGQDAGTWNGGLVPTPNSALLQFTNDVINFNNKHYDGIIFSVHIYDQWNFGDKKLANYFDRVLAQKVALIVGEYGSQNDVSTQPATASLFRTAVPRHIGRVVWHWDGSDPNKLTTDGGGWAIKNCSTPTNLTWLGKQVWNDTHS